MRTSRPRIPDKLQQNLITQNLEADLKDAADAAAQDLENAKLSAAAPVAQGRTRLLVVEKQRPSNLIRRQRLLYWVRCSKCRVIVVLGVFDKYIRPYPVES